MIEKYILNEYLRAFIIFLIIFLVIMTLIFILGRILPKLTSKTKTDLDNIILKKTSGPLTLIAVLVGIRFAIGEINLNENFNTTIEGIILTLIILVASFFIYYVFDTLIVVGFRELGEKGKKKINQSLVQFFHSTLKILIIFGTLLTILSSWGIKIGPLLAGLGIAGIAVAFSLQSTLSNIFGGISMLLDKSINVGDQIKLDENTSGKILSINLRSTKVRTFDNELIIIPNSKLSESNIQNVALPEPKTRVVVPFGVAYGSNVEKVKKLVTKELQKIENVVIDPEPSVKFLEMADSSLNFKAYFYVDSFNNRLKALDEANTKIYNLLNKNKIEIPFPQRDVHLKK